MLISATKTPLNEKISHHLPVMVDQVIDLLLNKSIRNILYKDNIIDLNSAKKTLVMSYIKVLFEDIVLLNGVLLLCKVRTSGEGRRYNPVKSQFNRPLFPEIEFIGSNVFNDFQRIF